MAEPGTVYITTFELTNQGAISDTYALGLISGHGWAALASSETVSLAAGESDTVSVQVRVPLSAAAGIVDETTIIAISVSNPEVLDTVEDLTEVEAVAGTRYVAEVGKDTDNSCLSETEPCQSLEWATAQALSGDEIKVAGGIYTNPDMAVEGRFLTIDKDLMITGGYTTTNWTISDPLVNPTIFDGENLGQIATWRRPASR